MLAPKEPRVDMEHIVRQPRGENHQRLFQIFCRQGAKEILVASVARWDAHLRMLEVLDRHKKRMMQCPNRLGRLWQRRRKDNGGALTWRMK